MIIPKDGDDWHVQKILYVDTADDKNINVVFNNLTFNLGTTIIQSSLVQGFNPRTKKIRRTFNVETGLEYWEAV